MYTPRRSNCLCWALVQKLRYGGRLHCRRSRVVRWLPHVSWTDKAGRRWSYSPRRILDGDTTACDWRVWFEGRPYRHL
jgi:hypothetical protein